MIKPERSLDFSAKQFRTFTAKAVKKIIAYEKALPGVPVRDVAGIQDFKKLIREAIPTKGTSIDRLLEMIFDQFVKKGVSSSWPRVFGLHSGRNNFSLGHCGIYFFRDQSLECALLIRSGLC